MMDDSKGSLKRNMARRRLVAIKPTNPRHSTTRRFQAALSPNSKPRHPFLAQEHGLQASRRNAGTHFQAAYIAPAFRQPKKQNRLVLSQTVLDRWIGFQAAYCQYHHRQPENTTYRCRALNRGLLLQITYTLPLRRTIWQSRWRFFAALSEDNTCISFPLFQCRHHARIALVKLAGAAFLVVLALFARVNRVRCR